jgi:hypothetical protein
VRAVARLGLVVVWLVGGVVAFAQTDVSAFEAGLKGKQWELRNYSDEAVVRYTWKDGKLESAQPAVRALTCFQVDSARLKGGTLQVKGRRSVVVFNSKKGARELADLEPASLEVNLDGADAATVLPNLTAELFFRTLDESIAALPQPVAGKLPYDVYGGNNGPARPTWIAKDGSWVQLSAHDPKLALPKAVFTPDPEYSEEARRTKVSAGVMVALTVMETGKVADLWLVVPAPSGLSEIALKAVAQYRFQPASYDGAPVEFPLFVEVKFGDCSH